jgi:hypothetical protein
VKLQEVFGISKNVRSKSYVDRGDLDERLRYLLASERHIVIHGDSKQGKSWLRTKVVGEKESIVIQCRLDTTPESMLIEALSALGICAELKRTTGNSIEGAIELSASGTVGLSLLGKLGIGAKGSGKAVKEGEVESQPIGRVPTNLTWVAQLIAASGKRLIIEDFHYTSEDTRKAFSFILKALVDLGVYAIVIGIWPQDNLLPYYNGDLDGRVEDIHLTWSQEELENVLVRGAEALNISMSPQLRRCLVDDAYSNVGLLQRITEQLCIKEAVLARRSDPLYLTVGESLERAREAVASDMRPRYEAFADNFVRGIRRLREGLDIYRCLLEEVTATEDDELLKGISPKELHNRMARSGHIRITKANLTRALERIDRLQAKMEIRPIVLTYNRYSERVFVVDRSFLFFRKYGHARWPWDEEEFTPTNDLADVEPLELT